MARISPGRRMPVKRSRNVSSSGTRKKQRSTSVMNKSRRIKSRRVLRL